MFAETNQLHSKNRHLKKNISGFFVSKIRKNEYSVKEQDDLQNCMLNKS